MSLQYALFDLDDTLYPRNTPVMPAIGERIKTYLMETLGLTYQEAAERRAYFNYTYGTVLRGLLQEEAVDIEEYLEFVHDIPVSEYIQPNPELSECLHSLPLRRLIFTNSYRKHAENVLAALGVSDAFEDIFDIRTVNYVSKPALHPYLTVVHRLGTTPDTCVYIDDQSRNLKQPKLMGMTTVLVDAEPNEWVDISVKNVVDACWSLRYLVDYQANED